jgi:hypothetical protein
MEGILPKGIRPKGILPKAILPKGILPKQSSNPACKDKFLNPFYIFPLSFTISLQPNIYLHISYMEKKDTM